MGAVLIDDSENSNLKDLGIRDSKLISPNRRRYLYDEIMELAKEVHFISVSAKEIDDLRKKMSLNEVEAMKIAELIEKFKQRPDKIIIDLPDPNATMFIRRISKYADVKEEIIAEHKADFNFPAVAAASIIAKVQRDMAVEEISKKYGDCGSGYPSDPKVIAFLNDHKGEELPFVRYSWSTAKRTIGSKKQTNLGQW